MYVDSGNELRSMVFISFPLLASYIYLSHNISHLGNTACLTSHIPMYTYEYAHACVRVRPKVFHTHTHTMNAMSTHTTHTMGICCCLFVVQGVSVSGYHLLVLAPTCAQGFREGQEPKGPGAVTRRAASPQVLRKHVSPTCACGLRKGSALSLP